MNNPRKRPPSVRLGRAVQRFPGGEFVVLGPRAMSFARHARRRPSDEDGPQIPAAPSGIPFLAATMLDELAVTVLRRRSQMPKSGELKRMAADVTEAAAVFAAEGWADNPAAFHVRPPAPVTFDLRSGEGQGVQFERLAFPSDYRPDERLPGAERWSEHQQNRSARAWVVRETSGEPRPWVIHLHGFGLGHASDIAGFSAPGYRDRGVNVLQPVFPLHGPRRHGKRSGEGAIGPDALATLFALSQAISDIRQCVLWARAQGATAIGLHGFSLGGYTAALLAGIDDSFDCVVTGVPSVDMIGMLLRGAPPKARQAIRAAGLASEDARIVHRVVSPLAFDPLVPHDRRFIYAALGDRVSSAAQAELLWRHWGRPDIHWLPSGHVRAMASRDVNRYVRQALYSSLLGDPQPEPITGG